MHNRDFRIQKAQETLQIIEQGGYTINNVEVNINQQIKQSVADTVLYSPDSFKQLLNEVEREVSTQNFQTQISIKNCTSIAAAEEIRDKGKIACLNFASAKNPGGGFQKRQRRCGSLFCAFFEVGRKIRKKFSNGCFCGI